MDLDGGWREPFVAGGFGGLADDFADQCAADVVGRGDLGQRLSAGPVTQDGGPVHVERTAADMPAFDSGAPHPCPTRSTIRLRSSSAMAPTMTTMARPSGPPVSICSRKLTNSIFK